MAWKASLTSLLLGTWSLPFGPLHTGRAIYWNLIRGGFERRRRTWFVRTARRILYRRSIRRLVASERAWAFVLVAIVLVYGWRISDLVSSTTRAHRVGVAWAVGGIVATGIIGGLGYTAVARRTGWSRLDDWIFDRFMPAVLCGGVYVGILGLLPLTSAAEAIALALPFGFVLALTSVALRFLFFPIEIPCECTDESCFTGIRIRAEEYRLIAAHPRRFLVRPGHEDPAVERVVRRSEAFVVVEAKTDD